MCMCVYAHMQHEVICDYTCNLYFLLYRPNITENRMIAQQRVKMAEERICSLKKQNEPVTEDMPQL